MVSNLILSHLYEELARVAHSHSIMAEVPAMFIDADTRIKGVQIEHHKIKQWILPMTSPFFLGDTTCLTRIEVILKLK